MAEKLTLRYDHVGDILYIDKCPAYAEQESQEIGDEIIARLNSVSGIEICERAIALPSQSN